MFTVYSSSLTAHTSHPTPHRFLSNTYTKNMFLIKVIVCNFALPYKINGIDYGR